MTNFPFKNLHLKNFKSSDDANLFYYKRCATSNKPLGTLLILCGWSQGPNNWSPVLLTNTHVKENYDVYVLVMRGYRNIEDNFNNNVARYAKDVVEFVRYKKLKNITALGHEMGCAVFCNVISLFGEKYFDSYVFVDNSLQVIQNPDWLDTDKKDNGCFFTVDQLFDFYNTCAKSASDSTEKRRSFEEQSFTSAFIGANPDIFIKIKSGTLNYNYKVANEILFNHAFNNYSQILKKGIKKPALLIGGKVSIVPYNTMANQKKFFELPTIKIFEENEGGSHSMYIENYELFNTTLNDFLKNKDSNIKNISKKYSGALKSAVVSSIKLIEKSIFPDDSIVNLKL